MVREVARTQPEREPDGADLDLVLAAVPHSVATARHAVARLLVSAPRIPTEVAEDVLLLVSELVTNAVLHARTAVRVSASAKGGHIMVSVGDDDPLHAPSAAERGTLATSGRGIRLVELLASSWGVEVEAQSKIVWFESTYEVEPPVSAPV